MYFTEKQILEFKDFDGDIYEYKKLLKKRNGESERIDKIIETICTWHNISTDKLNEDTKVRRVALPRQIFYWAAYYFTSLSLRKIGASLGNRNHSTVSHSVKTINDFIDVDLSFSIQMRNFEIQLESMGIDRILYRDQARLTEVKNYYKEQLL